MDIFELKYPFAYFQGTLTSFCRGDEYTLSYFGGPSLKKIRGLNYGPRGLHHIATINGSDIGLSQFGISSVPFYFGMCFDGCELEYSTHYSGDVNIEKMDPVESSSSWPYPSYPDYLPYFPLTVESTSVISKNEFSERVWMELSEDELVFVVPTNPELNFSMWGPDGDAEGVELRFVYNPSKEYMKVNADCS
ncbi:hypothetical protein FLL45_09870 [Aliikangiella marina]|uniref:Uncharacterized protein n=1 Tax=Aliikangiella marina TaxID=1712262 RepID=A0A545TDD2_9GAMM|nr:hypothetical protein [Aliikangiella marina]TQV75233.1 hypothetical protein FLL45_09870 [Aliikangiella marina]